MACFEIRNLSFSYAAVPDRPVLKNISLTIEQGQYVTVCGKSGCGKTTLLRHLKTVLSPMGNITGEILLDGIPLKDVDARTQSMVIGYVMQNPDSQIVTDKVWHELAFGLECIGTDQKTMRTRVAEMASYFGIQSWFHKDVSELSGGQKQLLNLASVMAMQPSVLILDEPTSQLDPITASDFLNTVRKINLELGTTIIITEHRLEDIYHSSDLVAVMDDGELICAGGPREVGDILHDKKNDIFAAMPAPVQIYYGTKDLRESAGLSKGNSCPLTVREGRTWLSDIFTDCQPSKTALTEEERRRLGVAEAESLASPDAGAVSAIELKDVWFRYEKNLPDIMKGVTFAVPKGELFALVGGNGTGKSTTMKAICGNVKIYRGKVWIDGKPLNKYKSEELFRNNLAMLPQDPQSLFVKQTLREELEEMLPASEAARYEKEVEKKGSDAVPLDPRIREICELCDITHLIKNHPYDLSGGEQQRAALAKVLLTNPKILLLDEPTKGIDNFFKLRYARILRDLKARGVTILMVSHDIEFCAKYADEIGMFFDGSLTTVNTPSAFFSRNSFYTTAANRMSRHIFPTAITTDDVIALINQNLNQK